MSEYSAEELLRLSKFIKDMQSVLGGSRDDNDDDEARAWDDYEKASSALAAYAERIETDKKSAVGYVATDNKIVFYVEDGWSKEVPPGTKLFTHPPAQAAQVDANAALVEAMKLPDGYEVVEHLPGIWGYEYNRDDGERMASSASWNHPALAAIGAWRDHVEALAESAEPVAQPADSGRVTDGWVLVPREPTKAMLDAAMAREDDEPLTDWGKIIPAPHAEIYKAMLAAAPQPGDPA